MDARSDGALQGVELDRRCAHTPTCEWGRNEGTRLRVVAPSVDQDTAVAVADEDTAMSEADAVLRKDALEWAANHKDHSSMVKSVDMFPPAVLDEQVRLHQASNCGAVVPRALKNIVVYPNLLTSGEEAAQV